MKRMGDCKMKITVIGSGYVGLVAGACLADLGNDVICLDVDENKIEMLRRGEVPIYEPGLSDVISRNMREKRLVFTTDKIDAIDKSKAIFIAVGTPEGEDHRADMKFVKSVAEDIGKYMRNYKIIINKSTVPVGTGDLVAHIIKENQKTPIDFDVVSNPEFLREGTALRDFTNPDRIVVGCSNERARQCIEEIYSGIARVGKPILFTDMHSAEIIKYASNAMLATRISFMNMIASLCEKVGANVKNVAEGVGLDSRIGSKFLQAGAGYGGSCFPKDVNALRMSLNDYGCDSSILDAVDAVNENQKASIVPRLKNMLVDLEGKNVAIWGLAFKPKTDDMREAPSIVAVRQLFDEGANVHAFDPEAQSVARRLFDSGKIVFCENPYDTLKEADALIIMTEWNEFRSIDLVRVKELMRNNKIVDARNIYNPAKMREHGFDYVSIGR